MEAFVAAGPTPVSVSPAGTAGHLAQPAGTASGFRWTAGSAVAGLALLVRGQTARAAAKTKAKKKKSQTLKLSEESFEEPDEAAFKKMAKKKKKVKFDPEEQIGVCAPLGFFDPLGFAKKNKPNKFKDLRAMEIKHGRVAMLATVGSVFQHFIHRPDLPAPWMTYVGPVNPKGLGALALFYGPPGFLQLSGLLFAVFCVEFFFWLEREDRDPGDFGNPLGIPLDTPDMRLKELNNGRFAMICILGIWAAELVTTKDAVEQITSLFGA